MNTQNFGFFQSSRIWTIVIHQKYLITYTISVVRLIFLQDFYTEDHWNRLPLMWKSTLDNIQPETLTDLFKLRSDTSQDQIIWPLALLCMRSMIQELSISRDSHDFNEVS